VGELLETTPPIKEEMLRIEEQKVIESINSVEIARQVA